MENILTRLSKYMNDNDLNNNQVTLKAGLSNGLLGNAFKAGKGLNSDSIEKILCAFNDISADWLLTGRGNMLKETDTQLANLEVKESFKLKTDDRIVERQTIPLYSYEATAGIVAVFADVKPAPIDYLSLPDLPPVDGAVYVRGDSMYPLLKSGDIVLYKMVTDLQYGVFWGEMYLVSATIDGEQYDTIKYVQKSDKEGHIRLVSHNPHHAPKDIPIEMVRAMAIIKASVRYNTMS